jgi:uncharacterized protein with beta-barrel porin domain
VFSAIPGTACTLDTDAAVLEVTAQGVIDSGTQTTVEDVVVHNAGLLAGTSTAIRFSGFGAASVFGNTGLVQAGGMGSAVALHVEGNVLGRVDNDGAISADASGNVAHAAGIVLDAGIADGTLDNAGIISVQAQGIGQASAYAISSGTLDAGTLINTGDADAEAISQTGQALAFGIQTYVLNSGSTVANSGKITALAEGSIDAAAESYGIIVDNLTGALIENRGEITTIARAVGMSRTARARGIVNGSFFISTNSLTTNLGTLTASASSADFDAYAWGIQMTSSMRSGTAVANQGDIRVDAAAGSLLAQAYGIWTPWVAEGASIASSGTISVAARASGSAQGYGIRAEAVDASNIASSGTITVSAHSRSGGVARAVGIIGELGLLGSATLTNDGLVQASASSRGMSPAATAEAAAVHLAWFEAPSLITNNGTLVAHATAGRGTATAFGISIDMLDGMVRNDGLISATSASPGGAYAVYAQAGSGSVVNNGALSGRLYLGGTVSLHNAGILDLHGQLSEVGGNYTQAGGRLGVTVRDVATHGRLNVGGIADLTGAASLRVLLDPAQRLHDGDVLGVVTAGTLLAPAAADLPIVDNSLFWRFTAASAGNTLNLRAEAVDTASVLAGGGFATSPSLAALADGLVAHGGADRYPELVAALTTAAAPRDVAGLLAQLQPALDTAASQATRFAGKAAGTSLGARLAELRGAAAGDVGAEAGAWLKPFLGRARQEDVHGVGGYELDSSGVTLGVDSAVTDTLRLGAALASVQSEVDSNRAGLDIDGLHFMLYGSHALDAHSTLEFDLGYGRNDYASRRHVDFIASTAQAAFGGEQYGLGVALNRRYALGRTVALTPSLELRHSRVRLDGHNETGAGVYGLALAERDDEAIQLVVRGSYEQTLPLGALLAGAGISYDTADAVGASATLAGGSPAFTSPGLKPETFALLGNAGYRYITQGGLEISALYALEGREGFRSQSALLKFRMPF